MAYRIRYALNVDWIGPGMAPGFGGAATTAAGSGVNGSPSGNAQTLQFDNIGNPVSATFLTGDVTALLALMSTDLSTQLNAALGRVQAFATGGS